jgi:beta-xylosidase
MSAVRPCLTLCCLLLAASGARADGQTGRWGDQGDGTYRNPVIAADYSDPDVVRVGSDYYLVCSTFESSPGVTVLHSKDLVNWETIGAAFSDISKLGPNFNWDHMNRYNEGIYAPSLRYHDGKFWVFVNCHSGEGFFQATATNPAGPWKVTQIRDKNGRPLRTSGWTDPCPFWDDDGKAYLASSRPGSHWYGYLFQMTPDGTQLLDADVDKMNVNGVEYKYPDGGTLFSPFQSTEGNKIFKRHGYYYLQHIEFLDQGHGHGTYLLRSRHLYGTKPDGSSGGPGNPGEYEVLKFGSDVPGQGGFVDTPDDRWFWLAQLGRYGSDGRPPFLLPATWIDDWLVPGTNIRDRKGSLAWHLPKPVTGQPISLPLGSDEFDGPTLKPQWLWNHQPRADAWSLTERPGFLRLHAFRPIQPDNFFKVGNVLNQRRMRSLRTVATVKLDLSGMAEGQEAGLAEFNSGQNSARIGVVEKLGAKTLQYVEDGKMTPGEVLPAHATTIWLQSVATFEDTNTFSYSFDGEKFLPFGGVFKLQTAHYRGDYTGIYTFNEEVPGGYVDADFFHYASDNR